MMLHGADRRQWSDRELLSAIASRDGAAFSEFYRRTLPTVLSYLMRETRDPEAAGDLAAEVFAAVLLSAHRYRPEGSTATPWVIGIARNKLLMSLRRGRVEARARKRLGFEAVVLADDDIELIEQVATDGTSALHVMVERLPIHERDAVRARVLEERSYHDIATELNCSELVVRKRVSRGLGRLRDQMTEGGAA
jgi:RNA polymerase sigma-70 factor (ECF subfamily)